MCHDGPAYLTSWRNYAIKNAVMITKFRTTLYVAGCLSLACIPALILSSCGGSSDSEEDLSHTIPVLPETVAEIVGYELRGPIMMEGEPPAGIYDQNIELIEFINDSTVNIAYSDDDVLQTSYSYVYNDENSVTITIDVPKSLNSSTTAPYDTYVLILTEPSTYYQVELGAASVYNEGAASSRPLYALNGSLNFLKQNQ